MGVISRFPGIDRLSVAERLELLEEIWDGLADDSSGSLPTPAQTEELRRRIAEDDANPDDAVPWERVLAETRARLNG